MIRTNKYSVPNLILPQNVLVSTFDKDRLEVLVHAVLSANSNAVFYSTGGTGVKLQEILGPKAGVNYIPVEEFTGCPEMEGGLVKTLHPKIHAGLLAERGNPHHEKFLKYEMAAFGKGPGVYFDVFAGNLYPFGEAVSKDGGSAEVARCYIDIGGPCMTMAAAKNWHSVTVLTEPDMYSRLRELLEENDGRIPAENRFHFAVEAMRAISDFRAENYESFEFFDFQRDVLPTIDLVY